MPSAFTHAATAGAIGAWFARPRMPRPVWLAGAACAILPDIDAIGYWMGVPYDSPFGHRGITHSLAFAALLAVLAGRALARRTPTLPPARLVLFLFLATASHGLLDTLTDGGGGIALFAPFSFHRFFAPVRPVAVAPMSIGRFFTARGLTVFASELRWIWLPALAVAAAGRLLHRRGAGHNLPSSSG